VSSYQRAPTGYKLCVSYTDRRKHTRFHKKAFLFKEMTFPAYYRETLIRKKRKKKLYKDLILGPVIKLIFFKKIKAFSFQ